MQDRFLRGQDVTSAYILPILSNIKQDYTADSDGIGADYKDAKSAVTPVVFNSLGKFILLLSYWELVLASMNSVVNKSKLDYLLCSRHSYTTDQRAALVDNIFKDSVADIAMNGSAFTDDNSCACDALIPGIFSTLA